MRVLHMIVDMQFGSCGKGLFAGFLAKKVQPDTIVTAWAPNAGHTFRDDANGINMVNICLPNGIIADGVKRVMFGPGTVVNPQLLESEMERYAQYMNKVRFMIHENAAVVTEKHRFEESQYGFKIGSTMKGCGAALIDKIRRDPDYVNTARIGLSGTGLSKYVVTKAEYNKAIDDSETVLVEGAQGFSLGINSGFYPYTTSRECTVQQLMVDCALPIDMPLFGRHVHGVCRTYPIRVANRFKDGVQVGTSGPCYEDQREIKWGDLGMEAELTTVTKLPRRIFTFSIEQIKQAVRMNGVKDVFLNFANYPMLDPAPSHVSGLNSQLASMIDGINHTGARVRWLGYGPSIENIKAL